MAFNLLEKTKSALNNRTAGQIAGLLDFEEESMGPAINVAMTALINGLTEKVQSPAGASELFEMVEQHDGSVLGNLGGLLTGGQHTMLIEIGQDILESVFGNKLASVASNVGKQIGLDADTTASLLGISAPILVSVLGKQKKAAGWDVDGFSSALLDQREIVQNVEPRAKRASVTGKHPSPARAVRETSKADPVIHGNGSLLKVVVPLLAIIVLVFLAWKFLIAP